MPPNNKKKKGRQQKVQQRQGWQQQQTEKTNVPAVGVKIEYVSNMDEDQCSLLFRKHMKDVNPEDIVERVRKGMARSTYIICNLLSTADPENAKGNSDIKLQTQYQKYLVRLVDAGLISVVLGLLQRCHETFDDVAEAGIGIGGAPLGNAIVTSESEIEVETRINEPGIWIQLLCNIMASSSLGSKRHDEVRMQIASDMGPFLNCMCDDVKRELFQSKQYWFGAVRSFAQFVYCLTTNTVGSLDGRKSAVSLIMKYDRLREFMAQSLFWGVHRPDILEEAESFKGEMEPDSLAIVADFAGGFLVDVLKSYEKEGENKFYFEGEGKELNYAVGTTPVVNGAYDPTCGLIFISGLIGLLKGGNANAVLASSEFPTTKSIQNLVTLLTVGGCVDKTTIEEIIDLGLNSDLAYDQAKWVVKVASEMTHNFEKDEMCCPKDKYVATAVEAGLFDMLLKLLASYGEYPDVLASEQGHITTFAFKNVEAVIGAATSKYTSKALGIVTPRVIEKLQDPQIKRLNSNGACKMIIENMFSLVSMGSKRALDEDDPLCCIVCSKNLSDEEARYCSKCKIVVYCSRECQVADWKAGHKKLCGQMRQMGKEQGGSITRDNVINMAGKFLDDNMSNIVMEATLRGYDILDCVVTINCSITNDIEVKRIDDYFGSRKEEKLQFRSMISRHPNALGFLFSFSNGLGAQHCMIFKRCWEDMQDTLRDSLPKESMSPELKKKYIAEVQSGYKL